MNQRQSSPVPPAVAKRKRLGRFELIRTLGRGAQATVWLAHDPRLEREVAIKLLDPSASAGELSQWLDEARAVSRLTHPNIVPVFEADEHDGQSCLVFEYVEGRTLAEVRRNRGPWPAQEAVQVLLGVLDAVAAAQAQGIVHRDLKPSNVLMGTDGRARVMDFGIAGRVAAGGDGRIVGTPGYMSPEAARGEPPSPQMDVFAAGMMLGELLAGAPLLRETDPWRAVERIQKEDMALPGGCVVDDRLRAIVMRAIARDTAKRYDSAQAMHAALREWAEPKVEKAQADAGHGTIEFLLRRMKHKSDFPALSESVGRIQRVASSETESLASLATEILKDVSLTNKLLRMVNSVHFASAGAGSISTISRAVALVGFASVRNMALSVVLLEHMQDKRHAALLKEEFLRALMAGTLAETLTSRSRDGEEAFIGSMFQNLGRLLTEYYFPEEAQQIRQGLKGDTAALQWASRESAAAKVLGLNLVDLGQGVAKVWGLPEPLQRCMRPPEGEPPPRGVERGVERMRWLGRAANEITDVMMATDPALMASRVGQAAEAYVTALGLPVKDIVAAAEGARERLSQIAQAMSITVAPDSPARRLLALTPVRAPEQDTLTKHELQSTLAVGGRPGATAAAAAADAPTVVVSRDAVPAAGGAATVAADPQRMAEMLAAGIQDITNSMVSEGFKLNEVLRMVLETMLRALSFRRVIFCLRDPRTGCLTGRFGLGEDAAAVSRAFRVVLDAKATDVFTAVCLKGVDTLIGDATAANIAAKLPAWYRQGVDAPSFLLLPMMLKNAPFGLIYADMASPGGLVLGEKELSLVRTLRNQAVMAFRQAERG